MVICKICKKEIKSLKGLPSHISVHNICIKDYYDKFYRKENEGICCLCKNTTVFIDIRQGYRNFCSRGCSALHKDTREKRKKTCIEKYGVEHTSQDPIVREKYKKTCMEKYGVENVSQNPIVKDKIKKTCIEKYGVEHALQNPIVKEKRKKTCLEKYGVEHALQNPIVREKYKKTCLEKYDTVYPQQNDAIKQKRIKTNLLKQIPKIKNMLNILQLELVDDYIHCQKHIKIHCLKCNNNFSTTIFGLQQGVGKCTICYPKYKSIGEQEIVNFIKNISFETIENDRKIIKPLELDIYIPNKKIGIEYNGLYWHSEKINNDKNYHLNKLNICQENDILLIQIFEDEWLFKQDIVKARLLQILKVSNSKRLHARKCIIKEIDPKLKNKFLETYHLQGKDNSKIKLGAFYNEELVSVMTFSKGNIAKGSKAKEGVWELNRFCSNYNYHIPGIASKLLTFFKRNYEYKQIFSYADRRWSVGNVYYKLGFSLDSITKPNYWYTKGLKRIHRFSLRKRFDEPKDITESILRIQEGYSKIWDCGHLKFNLAKC